MSETCEHSDFSATVNVHRMDDIKRYIAEIMISCKACGTPFHFMGIPEWGLSFCGPALDVGGCELRIPIMAGALSAEECRRLQYDLRLGEGEKFREFSAEDLSVVTQQLEEANAEIARLKKELGRDS